MSCPSVRTVASIAFVVLACAAVASAQPPPGRPWVYEASDTSKETTWRRRATGAEIGSLNLMTSESRNAVLSRLTGDGAGAQLPDHHRAIAIIQVDSLEDLARDKVYEFGFIAASLRPRGAAAVQFRPLAFPSRP